MAAGAAKMVLQCIFDGTILTYDTEIERRPYHRNCGCMLHKSGDDYSNACCAHCKNIYFTKKRSWSESSLSVECSNLSSSHSFIRGSSASNRAH
ncbi:hypothetical protein ACSBR2_005493 [Camellia fascicularis]